MGNLNEMVKSKYSRCPDLRSILNDSFGALSCKSTEIRLVLLFIAAMPFIVSHFDGSRKIRVPLKKKWLQKINPNKQKSHFATINFK